MKNFLILFTISLNAKDINLPMVLVICFSLISSPFVLARAFAKVKSTRKNKQE